MPLCRRHGRSPRRDFAPPEHASHSQKNIFLFCEESYQHRVKTKSNLKHSGRFLISRRYLLWFESVSYRNSQFNSHTEDGHLVLKEYLKQRVSGSDTDWKDTELEEWDL
ncbi:hypothetical protein CDAR_511541 [Caerostris darwini]|uniref:Ycf15 n=1 Tax=Caerostris darwini TaxID=1538125 RepID=A0AAV4TLP4_9ARAC|nr:hypothetical protein CDAR_511541 [Caerostris darwini]